MAATILLDIILWDLVLDADGNIARADEPYALAQDAASAIKTFAGEAYFDTTIGVPYLQQILGKNPSVSQLKSLFTKAAQTVPGVQSAVCFIEAITDRGVTGQVQVTPVSDNPVSATNFTVANPQGA